MTKHYDEIGAICYVMQMAKNIRVNQCISCNDLLNLSPSDKMEDPVFIFKEWFDNKGKVKSKKVYRWHKSRRVWIKLKKTTKIRRIKK